MSGRVKILLVGAGGYGHIYVDALLGEMQSYPIDLVGVIDPLHSNPSYIKMVEAGVPEYDSLESFYRNDTADLCIISTPISLHKIQTVYALSHGSNVLCEKPAAGCTEDVRVMIEAQKQSGKFASVGFQLSYSEAVLNLKKDIQSGVWGKPILFKSITLFPRTYAYFNRGWAGKKYSSNGTAIMDSIANNGAAHSLHNMFFLLGDEMDTAAMPISCDCCLYRANDIETFDAAAARFETSCGTDVLYYAAHSIKHNFGPAFELICDNGTISFGVDNKNVVGVFKDGTVKDYGEAGEHIVKLRYAIETLLSGENKIYCNLETSMPHAIAVEMLGSEIDAGRVITPSAQSLEIVEMKKNENGVIIKGLEEKFREGFKRGILLK